MPDEEGYPQPADFGMGYASTLTEYAEPRKKRKPRGPQIVFGFQPPGKQWIYPKKATNGSAKDKPKARTRRSRRDRKAPRV